MAGKKKTIVEEALAGLDHLLHGDKKDELAKESDSAPAKTDELSDPASAQEKKEMGPLGLALARHPKFSKFQK